MVRAPRDVDAELEAMRPDIEAVHRALGCSEATDSAFDAGVHALSSLWHRHCDGELPVANEREPAGDTVLRQRAFTAFRILEIEEARQVRDAGRIAFDARFGADFAARDAVIDALDRDALRARLKCVERIRVLRADRAAYTYAPVGEHARGVIVELERRRDEDAPPTADMLTPDPNEDWVEDRDVPVSRWRQLLVDAWRNGLPDTPIVDHRAPGAVIGWGLRRRIYAIGVMYTDSEGEPVRRRCLGWEPTLAEAQSWLTESPRWLLDDGYYNLLLIEEVFDGLHHVGEQYWYGPAVREVEVGEDGRKRLTVAAMQRIEPPAFSRPPGWARICGYWIG